MYNVQARSLENILEVCNSALLILSFGGSILVRTEVCCIKSKQPGRFNFNLCKALLKAQANTEISLLKKHLSYYLSSQSFPS